MILSDAAIKNRTTIWVLIVLVVVAGTASYVALPRESAPDVPTPYVLVTTIYEGVSPEDVETAVTMEIEQELTGLKGVKEITSVSREGVSQIQIEFMPDVEIEDALARVRDKVDLAKPDLPREAEEPALSEINIAEFPIMMISIGGPISPVLLKSFAEDMEDHIEQIPGVLDCEVLGALEREIRLEFDPDRLAAYNISVPELVGLIPGENVNISAGGLETPGTKFNVRVPGEFARPEDIDTLLLTVRDGRPIYLTDIATVTDTFKDRTSYARVNGEPAITLTVKKRVGANIIEISDQVKAILDEARKILPRDVEIALTMDESNTINLLVSDLENSILTGLVLVVGVLMLALGLRTSLIVGAAIPLSMLMSFALLNLLGITLNLVVLFSLVLALGMLVDNAIVIVENIYRFVQEGYNRREAAMKATSEVAWPVIASTATTIVAFAPMAFWPGIVGEFMSYLPITVIIVLSCSLFVAMAINPVIASVLVRKRKAARKESEETMHPVERAYRGLLSLTLGTPTARIATLLIAVFVLMCVSAFYGKYNHGTVFFPELDPDNGLVNIRGPQGTNIEQTDLLARVAEARINAVESEHDDLKYLVANVGSEGGAGGFGDQAVGPHIANVTLVFKDFKDRRRPSAEAINEIRELLKDLPGAEVKVAGEEGGPPRGADVAVRFTGDDFDTLERLSEQARPLIAGVPGVVNLRSDHEAARPELQFTPDRRRAMLLGVNTDLIGQFLKTSVFGREVSTYREFNDEYDITIRLPLEERTQLEDLLRLNVPNVNGDPVPLSNIGTFEYRGGFGDIYRVDQKRAITLGADSEGRNPEETLKDVKASLAEMTLPPGYQVSYVGVNEDEEEASEFLSQAFAMALLFILLILVMQFNTVGVPFIVLTTVVLSMVGVLVGLLATGTPFTILMTGIGVVSLAGVVVNNAIVLLDYTRQLEKRGLPLVEAAVKAGATRLRPVLLTAVTTILGLVPMATGWSFDFRSFAFSWRSETSQWWAPMAIAVIFGLGFATVLTLVVVPTMYVAVYALLERLGLGGLKRKPEREEEAAFEASELPEEPELETVGAAE